MSRLIVCSAVEIDGAPGIAHDDTLRGGGIEIDGVEADARPRDHFEHGALGDAFGGPWRRRRSQRDTSEARRHPGQPLPVGAEEFVESGRKRAIDEDAFRHGSSLVEPSSRITLLKEGVDLGTGRHVVGTHHAAGDDGSCGVAVRTVPAVSSPRGGRGKGRHQRHRPIRVRRRPRPVGREPFAKLWRGDHDTVAPSFTIAASRPRSSMRSAASSGSSVPTATSHSLRLPMAMVTWSSIGEIAAWACSSLSQNIGRQSRSSTV